MSCCHFLLPAHLCYVLLPSCVPVLLPDLISSHISVHTAPFPVYPANVMQCLKVCVVAFLFVGLSVLVLVTGGDLALILIVLYLICL